MEQQQCYYGVDVQQALDASINLAYEAGKMGLGFTTALNQGNLSVEIKPDTSPVTIADKTLNEYIVSRLQKQFQTARVIGEESIARETTDLGIGAVFFVDPIDGTKEFLKNNGEWAVMIGLVVDAKPVMGVVYRPTVDDLYYASLGKGAFKVSQRGEPKKLTARTPTQLSECTFLMSRSHSNPEITNLVKSLGADSVVIGSFGIKCGYVGEGLGDVYINVSKASHYWDACMNDILLTEAGAVLLTEQYTPISYTGLSTRITQYMYAFPGSLDKKSTIDFLNQSLKQ